MRILITGPHGQIGWDATRVLRRLGEVIPVDRTRLDLTDTRAIRRVVRDIAPDVIVNAAGYTGVDQAEEEPQRADDINAIAPGVLAEEAARLDATIVHFSTDYVFDGTKDAPYAADDLPNPLNVYGITKLAGEQAIIRSGAAHLILRTSWVYSARRHNFLLTMLRHAAAGRDISVVDDQHGGPTWSRRIAEGATRILATALVRDGDRYSLGPHEGTYHLAGDGVTTWFDFARHIFTCAEIDPPPLLTAVTTEQYPCRANRPRYSALDCTSTAEEFGVQLGPWTSDVAEVLRTDLDPVGAPPEQKEKEHHESVRTAPSP